MQKRDSIINIPLLIGIALSIITHGAIYLFRGAASTPARPKMEQGATVVQLTLIPSLASPAHPESTIVEEIKELPSPEELLTEETPPKELDEFVVDKTAPLEIEQTPEPKALPEKEVAPPPPPSKKPPAPAATEQIASIAEQKGVTADACPAKSFRPKYPRMAQRRGEQGSVILSLSITADGRVNEVKISQSSGFKRLDNAAREAAQKTEFSPSLHDGKAVDSTIELSYTFRLTDK